MATTLDATPALGERGRVARAKALRHRVKSILVASGCLLLATSSACRRVERPRPQPKVVVPPAKHEDAAPSSPAPNGVPLVAPGPDFASLAEQLGPSVVTVISTVPREGGRRNKVVRGLGSGMLVSANGEILTNEHVVAWATRVDVELSNGERYPARILVAEPLLDLALLELDGDLDGLLPVTFSDEPPRPGEWVMAIGQPFGLGHTLTVGVISGLGRDHDDLGRPDGLRADGIWNFIQTDASINIGNSGGPLVNTRGHVVGITTAVRNDGQGLAFAMPGAMGRRFLEEARTHGRVRHTRLGIKAENASGMELPGNRSVAVRVTQVDPAGPAGQAQLQPGDYILAIDGVPVRRVSDVAYLTQLRGVGAELDVTVVGSDGLRRQVAVTPIEGASDPSR